MLPELQYPLGTNSAEPTSANAPCGPAIFLARHQQESYRIPRNGRRGYWLKQRFATAEQTADPPRARGLYREEPAREPRYI